MIGIKNFATCECDLPAIGDPNTNPEYIYRFRCPTQQRQDGERGCDFSLTISLEDVSSTIPPYYKFEIEETDQKFESFHKKPLRAFLEWRGMTRKRTQERTVQILEGSVLKRPEHGVMPVIVDIVEKEDRQKFLERLLAYNYIAVIDERIQQLIRKDCEGCREEYPSQLDHDCCAEDQVDLASRYFDNAINELYSYDHEAVLRWHDLTIRLSHSWNGMELFEAYQSYRKNIGKWIQFCRDIFLQDSMHYKLHNRKF